MLILGRRREQAIRIGDDVDVVVLGIEGGLVKLGISAPTEVPVVRAELLEEDGAQSDDGRPPRLATD